MSQTVAIIDYGSGNLHSAHKAFVRASSELAVTHEILVTSDPDRVASADRVVLPGVGAFGDCRAGLDTVPDLYDAIDQAVSARGQPFLGICVGMQLMATRGLEHGVHAGFDWIPGDVDRINPVDPALKIPHMGWNTLNLMTSHPLFDGVATGPDGLHAYFVHSYHLVPEDSGDLVAEADYGGSLTAAVARDNRAGTQFHPEKSQALGLSLIRNFLCWCP